MKQLLLRLIRRFQPRRIVILDRPPLTEREIREAFTVPADHPMWLAFHQCLEKMAVDCRDELTTPEAADKPGVMAHYAGGARVLEQLQDWLFEIRADAFAARKQEDEE